MKPISRTKLEAYKERYLFGERTPITAEISLTDVCPFHCIYCRYTRTSDCISLDDFEKLLQVLLSWKVRGVMLCGGGEPQCNTDFESICRLLNIWEMPFGVTTNFALYKTMNPSWVRVSIHAESTEHCWENIRRFRREHASASLGIQGIILKPGEAEVFVYRMSLPQHDVGANYISLRPVEGIENAYTPSDLEAIKQEIAELQRHSPKILRNYKWDFVGRHFTKCSANWTSVFIDSRCNVAYCCNKPNDIVGSIFDEDILAKRERYISKTPCESPCRHSGNNETVDKWDEDSDPEVESFV